MNRNTFERLDDLSDRVMAGEVVFFIGAGFSLDSEGNTALRLMRRLIVRFAAITAVLRKVNKKDLTENKDNSINYSYIRDVAKEMRHGFMTTFNLPRNRKLYAEKNIEFLSKLYYQINDWFCSAFCILLKNMQDIENKIEFCKRINLLENEYLKSSNSDKEPLETINLKVYKTLTYPGTGKALFLDTMGFDNSKIMGGLPHDDDINKVINSCYSLLRKRHHVLARLACEGLSNPLITTNYDLLLEGAYRLAGFIHKDKKEKKTGTKVLCPHFKVISDANDFFKYGGGHRTALLVKIHGCVHKYRDTKTKQCECVEKKKNNQKKQDDKEVKSQGKQTDMPEKEYWGKYLPSMVFTFREIQNWREDAWSRDYVRTMLRTRTIVFCGYSGADPVLHDTFRSVYEEMEKQRQKSIPINNSNDKEMNAGEVKIPAFFFGVTNRKEFHGMEILRAASKAVGREPDEITSHPNYLHFFAKGKKFPGIDDAMVWLCHLTCRKIQLKCLESYLQQSPMRLFGKPCPVRELEDIITEFKSLFKEEKELPADRLSKAKNRDLLYRITSWSYFFHPELLKEYAIAEDRLLALEVRNKIGDKLSPYWYLPFSEKPGWTAWAVVLEIALRKMISAYYGKFKDWRKNDNSLEVLPIGIPALSISQVGDFNTPILLEIKLRTGSVKSSAHIPGVFRKKHTWFLSQNTIPWDKKEYITNRSGTNNGGGIPVAQTPGAKTIWDCAVAKNIEAFPLNKEEIAAYFGEKYGQSK